MPHLNKFKLDVVADALSLPEFQHHRAADDALTCGLIFHRLSRRLAEMDIHRLQAINPAMPALRAKNKISDRHARHIILFAKNQTGLRNLYRLISLSNLQYFKRNPRIPKSELITWREGLIVGSACEAGELFQAVINHKSEEELLRIASFYDFLEIQPLANNRFMLDKGLAENEEELREFNRTIVRLGQTLGKPVVATGDVHFLNPEDEIYRHILLATKGFEDCDKPNPLYSAPPTKCSGSFPTWERRKPTRWWSPTRTASPACAKPCGRCPRTCLPHPSKIRWRISRPWSMASSAGCMGRIRRS